MLGRIIIRYLVNDLGILDERHEAMGETLRHQYLVPLFCRDFQRDPLPESRRAFADIDRHIQNCAARDTNQLVLRKWRQLIMKPTHNALGRRIGVIVLNESQIDTGFGE